MLELAAYRIVQEALTNVIRHADAETAAVSVSRKGSAVVVEVVNDGPERTSLPAESSAMGFGLIGMTERALAIGGHLEYGPVPGGGFRVHAVLPLEGDRS